MQNRFKSPVVWAAVLLQLVLVIGLVDQEISKAIKIIGGVIIESLTLLGLLNNPTNPSNF